MEPGSSFGFAAVAALVCVVLGFGAFVLWFFARLDRAQEEARDARDAEDAAHPEDGPHAGNGE